MGDMPRTTFKWSNYTKPTPRNLLGFVSSIRRIMGGLSATTVIMEANPAVPATLIITMMVVDEVKNFFAMVNDDVTETAVAEMPSGKEVTVTAEKPKQEEIPD